MPSSRAAGPRHGNVRGPNIRPPRQGASLSRIFACARVSALCFATIVAVAAPAHAATGAVAAYGFNEGTGSAITDASGTGNSGATSGTAWAAGKFGSALSFNGSGSVTIPDSSSLDLSAGMTLEAWVDPTALVSAWRTAIFKQSSSGMVYSLYANNGAARPTGQVNILGEQNAAGT